LVFRSPTDWPSIVIAPSWNGSRPLTALIKVDLPRTRRAAHHDHFALFDFGRAAGQHLERPHTTFETLLIEIIVKSIP